MIPVRNIYCIGRNYEKHAAELKNPVPTGEPVLFLKATSSLRRADDAGVLAYGDETFHHEVEIVFQVGTPCARGSTPGAKVLEAVAVGLDLTRRDKQNDLKAKGLPWVLAKSFAGAAVLSEFKPLSEVGELGELGVRLHVADQLRQQGAASDMIFSPEFLVNWLAGFAPLERGDIIFTGTPEGVGPIKRGDSFFMELWSGSVQNPVIQCRGIL